MIKENHPYIQERLSILAAVAEHGPGSLPQNISERTRDLTTIMVSNWKAARTEEGKLRAETLRCVTFTAKGKIEVHDAESLEALNTRISELVRLRETIESAAVILQDQAPGYLHELEATREAAKRDIENIPRMLNQVLGTELKDFNAASPEAAMKSRRYPEAKKRSEATMHHAKAKLETLEPQIALIKEQLAACEAVMVEVEKPTPGPGSYKSVISRDKAGVMG